MWYVSSKARFSLPKTRPTLFGKFPGRGVWTRRNTSKPWKLGTHKQVNCNRKVGACKTELADLGLNFHYAKSVLPPVNNNTPIHKINWLQHLSHLREKTPARNMAKIEFLMGRAPWPHFECNPWPNWIRPAPTRMIEWCLCNTAAATASWASMDLNGIFWVNIVGPLISSNRADGKRQPARCSHKTQDKFATFPWKGSFGTVI